ncbi:hypothetical protein F4859DRAFT_515090 [Xylaria cf. heliscus]|nr:hypothetical protein F4859DRAFT_515090 [Xylaria cf. heliscus]
MEKTGRSEDIPSSPWATRYPLDRLSFIAENTNHSVLAPFPRVDDPRYYDHEPTFTQEDIPKENENIDKLLWSEMVQAHSMHGKETWQAAVLSRYLQFSPDTGFVSGGHRPVDTLVADLSVSGILPPPPQSLNFVGLRTGPPRIATNEERDYSTYLRERIKVDESKWLPFLRKDRWYDWIQVAPPFDKPGRTWTVDDPEIWDYLKVILELVNRILLALIEDKHEGDYWSNLTDIFGDPPSEDAIVHLSYAKEREICVKRGIIHNPFRAVLSQTSADWRARLEKLLRQLVWTFNDPFPSDAINTRLPCVGNNTYPFPSVNSIGIRALQTALNSKLALSELCSMQLELAIQIVHELMHAIIGARYIDDQYVGNRLDPERTGLCIPEPFLNGQGIAETGHYMDQLFWGGVISSDPGGATKAGAPPLGLCITEWPWDGYVGQPAVPDSAFMEPGAIIRNHHVPSTWVSKMLSESFWQDPAYPKKSANFFHRNAIFVSESPNVGGGPATYNPPQVRDLEPLPVKYPGDTMLVEAWEERKRFWDEFRDPWHAAVKHEWLMSPWSKMTERLAFFEFEDGFAKRNLITCAKAAEKLVNAIMWDQGMHTLVLDMPSRPRTPDHCLWAWHVVGLLMMASIPIQHLGVYRLTDLNAYLTEHAPSRGASAGGYNETMYLKKDLAYNTRVVAGPSKFFGINGERGDPNTITQLDYLRRADDMIQLLMTNGSPVHSGFLNAIIAAKEVISSQRQELVEFYPGGAHATRWTSSWPFKFPAYDPAYVSFSQADRTWRSIDSRQLDN